MHRIAFMIVVFLSAGPALAASDFVDMSAEMPGLCVLGASSGGGVVTYADIDETDNDARANQITKTETFGDSYCNLAHDVTLSVSEMALAVTGSTQGAGSDPFDDAVQLKARLSNWHSGMGTLAAQSGGGAQQATLAGAFRNDAVGADGLTLEIETQPTTHPLLSGDYGGNGEISVTLAPSS